MSYGNFLSLAAGLIWAFSTRLYRQYGDQIHPINLTILKGILAGSVLGTMSWLTGGFKILDETPVMIIAVSGVIGIGIGDCAYFSAFSKIGATLTASIQCIIPLLTGLSAWLFLGEDLTPIQCLGMALTSGAILSLVLNTHRAGTSSAEGRPRRNFAVGLFYAVLAAICQTGAATISKTPLKQFSAFEGSFYRIAASTIVLLFLIPMTGQAKFLAPSRIRQIALKNPSHVKGLFLASILGTVIGLWCMIEGIKYSPLGIALTLNSTYPLWIVVIDAISQRKKPDFSELGSLALAILGIYLTA
jgi:drug/metabolite transporter (DMT)-like permease